MLRIDFINVGDGDAVLVRLRRPGRPNPEEEYVLLVDCGRPEVESVPGSRRTSAEAYLRRCGVDHIDLLLLTHLHFDHIGGALSLLAHFPVRALTTGYYPPPGAGRPAAPAGAEKTVVGLYGALAMLYDIVALARERGTACLSVPPTPVLVAAGLELVIRRPLPLLALREQVLMDRIYGGWDCTDAELFEASKGRNCTSLITRLGYAGASVLLTGDAYAPCWEEAGEPPCDVLKLPHHGDGKSMTEPLLKSLSPRYAVISCQSDPPPHKQRPQEDVVAMLLRHVPHVLCTENRAMPQLAAVSHDAVRFVIDPQGRLRCLEVPEGGASGRR